MQAFRVALDVPWAARESLPKSVSKMCLNSRCQFSFRLCPNSRVYCAPILVLLCPNSGFCCAPMLSFYCAPILVFVVPQFSPWCAPIVPQFLLWQFLKENRHSWSVQELGHSWQKFGAGIGAQQKTTFGAQQKQRIGAQQKPRIGAQYNKSWGTVETRIGAQWRREFVYI